MSYTVTHHDVLVGATNGWTPEHTLYVIQDLLMERRLDATVTQSHGYTRDWGFETGHVVTLYDATTEEVLELAEAVRRNMAQDEVWVIEHAPVLVHRVRCK